MAREVRNFAVTVAVGSTPAVPQTTALAMPSRIVREVRVRIPPGPRGQVGFRLASGGVQVVPWQTGTYLVADNESIVLPLEGQLETGAWQLQAYNVGDYDHTLYVTFLLDPISRPDQLAFASAPLDLGP